MGVRFRKSIGFGPFRVTLTPKALSYSAGVKGFRVTKRADGKIQRTYSIPGTGVAFVKSDRPSDVSPTVPSPGTPTRSGMGWFEIVIALIAIFAAIKIIGILME
jgi:uncharacterized protein DUF4236